jgi:hypothetical protein
MEIFKNGTIDSYNDSPITEDITNLSKNMYGGLISRPNGGFPPLYECKENVKKERQRKEVKSINNKNLLSISKILQKRKNPLPFI